MQGIAADREKARCCRGRLVGQPLARTLRPRAAGLLSWRCARGAAANRRVGGAPCAAACITHQRKQHSAGRGLRNPAEKRIKSLAPAGKFLPPNQKQEVERYLSQLCQLVYLRPGSSLEKVLVDLCAQSLRIAVKVRRACCACCARCVLCRACSTSLQLAL